MKLPKEAKAAEKEVKEVREAEKEREAKREREAKEAKEEKEVSNILKANIQRIPITCIHLKSNGLFPYLLSRCRKGEEGNKL